MGHPHPRTRANKRKRARGEEEEPESNVPPHTAPRGDPWMAGAIRDPPAIHGSSIGSVVARCVTRPADCSRTVTPVSPKERVSVYEAQTYLMVVTRFYLALSSAPAVLIGVIRYYAHERAVF